MKPPHSCDAPEKPDTQAAPGEASQNSSLRSPVSSLRLWLAVGALLALLAAGAVWLAGAGFAPATAPAERFLRRVFEAQWEYHAFDRDGDGYLEFADDLAALPVSVERPDALYAFRVFAVKVEQRAPDGGMLAGFIVAAMPRDPAATAHVIDHFGNLQSMPALLLDAWLAEHCKGD